SGQGGRTKRRDPQAHGDSSGSSLSGRAPRVSSFRGGGGRGNPRGERGDCREGSRGGQKGRGHPFRSGSGPPGSGLPPPGGGAPRLGGRLPSREGRGQGGARGRGGIGPRLLGSRTSPSTRRRAPRRRAGDGTRRGGRSRAPSRGGRPVRRHALRRGRATPR